MLSFKKVSDSFAISKDYEGYTYYFYPDHEVNIAHRRN